MHHELPIPSELLEQITEQIGAHSGRFVTLAS